MLGLVRSFLIFWSLCLSLASLAEPLDVKTLPSGSYVGQYSYLIPDESGEMTFESLPPPEYTEWTASEKEIPAFGYSDITIWSRIDLVNSGFEKLWFVDVSYPVLDVVEVYVKYPESVDTFYLGDRVLFNNRPINHRNFVVPVKLGEEKVAVYVKVKSGTSLQVPIKLWREKDFNDHQQGDLILQGIYFGFMIVMVLYNLFLYSFINEVRYIHYVSFVTSFVLFQTAISGFGYQFLWSYSPAWNEHSLPIFLGLVLLTESIFVSTFLELSKKAPKVATFFQITAFIAGLIAVSSVVLPYRYSILSLIILALPINLVCLVMGLKQWLQGDRAAKLFTIAWFSTLTGAMFLSLNKLGVLERNVFTENALQIGTALEVVLLSFALGEYISRQRNERQQVQEQTLNFAMKVAEERELKLNAKNEALELERIARAAQEQALHAHKEANYSLEKQVQERTSQLESAMNELQEAHAKLKHVSNQDELTELFNRRYFNKKFQAEYKRARRLSSPLAVIIADLDKFKAMSDEYGHLVGDECLKAVAEVLKTTVTRPMDTVARFGGEEFIVLLPDTPMEGAVFVAEKLRAALEEVDVHYEDLHLRLTMSLGVVSHTPNGQENHQDIIARADEALYQAKEDGRNCVRSLEFDVQA